MIAHPKPLRDPRFLWRGLLVTLPVLVLAAGGLASLRQDRMLVELEARERAQEVADALVPGLWNVLTNARESILPVFTIGSTGAVVFPVTFRATPSPGIFHEENLNETQLDLWQAAERAPGDRLVRWQNFLGSNPPANHAAVAHYAIGMELMEAGRNENAAQQFEIISTQYPDTAGETGLPLKPLADFKWLSLRPGQEPLGLSLGTLCSNLVRQPTLLTPFLLDAAAELSRDDGDRRICENWAREWTRQQTGRQLAAAFLRNLRFTENLPSAAWIPPATEVPAYGTGSDRWLALRIGLEHGVGEYVCRREQELPGLMNQAVAGSPRIPPYFAIGVMVGGRWLDGMAGSGSAAPSSGSRVLASAVMTEGDPDSLRVAVLLADPASLFARQRKRSLWFGLLIGAAAVAALGGFVGTWRAYAKERRLNELKSNFVSSVSHELRAPIASVRLMAESLDRGKITEPVKQRDYFRFISQECRRLSALIENVLDFARIEQGRKQYEFEAADLLALARNTIALLEPGAAEREVKLALRLPTPEPESVVAVVDAKALQRALLNLVDNAIKHSSPGSEVAVALEPGQPLRLWVEDHGPGIPAGEHSKIFERFYRRGSELRRETQGVGIGLSIVKHIVEAHGGRVLVRSAVGEGSRFTIELPARPEEKAQ